MCGNEGARRLIYCRFSVGESWEMNGRRKKKKTLEFRISEAFTRANMGSARANCSLGGSARANLGPLERTPFWKGSAQAITILEQVHSSEPGTGTGTGTGGSFKPLKGVTRHS